jgi:hypothetical protein
VGAATLAFLVGQAPSRTSRAPLDGRCGKRLAELAGLSGYDELTAFFAVGNLHREYPGRRGDKGDHFDRALAREAALRFHELFGSECWDRVVLLGRNVAHAFGLAGAPYLSWLAPTTGDETARVRHGPPPRLLTRAEHYARGEWLVPDAMQHLVWPDARFAVFPHPSGVSHFWNDPRDRARAARFMRALVRDPG